jgi:hypothetical protein
MKNCESIKLLPAPERVLTDHDVLLALRKIQNEGWGELRVVIQDGYIATLHTSSTVRGLRPAHKTH